MLNFLLANIYGIDKIEALILIDNSLYRNIDIENFKPPNRNEPKSLNEKNKLEANISNEKIYLLWESTQTSCSWPDLCTVMLNF